MRSVVLDCYLLAIKNMGNYAVELNQEITAPHRKYLKQLGEEVAKDAPDALMASRSTLRGLLRDYRDKAAQYLSGLRDELSATARALEEILEHARSSRWRSRKQPPHRGGQASRSRRAALRRRDCPARARRHRHHRAEYRADPQAAPTDHLPIHGRNSHASQAHRFAGSCGGNRRVHPLPQPRRNRRAHSRHAARQLFPVIDWSSRPAPHGSAVRQGGRRGARRSLRQAPAQQPPAHVQLRTLGRGRVRRRAQHEKVRGNGIRQVDHRTSLRCLRLHERAGKSVRPSPCNSPSASSTRPPAKRPIESWNASASSSSAKADPSLLCWSR